MKRLISFILGFVLALIIAFAFADLKNVAARNWIIGLDMFFGTFLYGPLINYLWTKESPMVLYREMFGRKVKKRK